MTETATLTLGDFLLARIAEDEALARAARSDALAFSSRPPYAKLGFAAGDLAQQFDPARVLAECAAKRRIVRDTQAAAEAARSIRDTFADRDDARARIERGNYDALARAWQDALHLLAQPYADRPDYRQEWRV